MSAQATGWVFDRSPYKGALFTLHLTLADIVNDTYGNELWASVAHISEKSRLGERIIRKGLAQMVDDGLLELLSAKNGHIRRYRFLTPDPCTTCTPAHGAPLHVVPETPAPRAETPAPGAQTPARRAPVSQRTQAEPNGEPNSLVRDLAAARNHRRPQDVTFDEFWAVYPLRRSKAAAKAAWLKAIKKADPAFIIAAAAAHRDDPARDPDYTKYPATWLNDECWDDEPTEPRRKHSKATTAAKRALDRYGLTEGKELNP